jgi:hypothetical protein
LFTFHGARNHSSYECTSDLQTKENTLSCGSLSLTDPHF